MSKTQVAYDVVKNGGVAELLRESLRYTARQSRRFFYSVKSTLGSDVVSINGVKVDTGYEYLTPMTGKLRGGRYEVSETKAIQAHLSDTDPVIDLGAGIGYTSVLADRRVQPQEQVVAVEANELLVPVIERTRELNNADFLVEHASYGVTSDTVEFSVCENFYSSSTYDRDEATVQTVTVETISTEELVDKYDISGPFQLIVDIEGGERELLTEEIDFLTANCKLVIIEFHDYAGADRDTIRNQLVENGFTPVGETSGTFLNSRFET